MSVEARHGGLGAGGRNRFAILAIVVALLVAGAVYLSMDDESSSPPGGISEGDRFQAEQAQALDTLVERGEMPRETLEVVQPDGTMSWDLNGDGATTDTEPVLRFDLDGNGRPEGVTEQELMNEFTRRAAALDR